jgi:nucleoside 2-deoxyribosyltransferase
MMTTALKPRVYLAGPGVFRPDPVAFGRALKTKCGKAGLEGCFPMDSTIEEGTRLETARAIYLANVALIDSVQAVIADISPFRGPNMDPGTAWEIGYGIAKGLPVFAWSDDSRVLIERTERNGDRDADGWHIENFGLSENLMIAMSSTSLHRTADEAIAACAAALRAS